MSAVASPLWDYSIMIQRCHRISSSAVYPSALTVFSWLCTGMKGDDRNLDVMIGSIILILQRLLLALITSCTIYVVCKSSDPHCAPNNSRAICQSCSSLSLLPWKQIVPSFIGRMFSFSVTALVMMHQKLRGQASFFITRCSWKSFWRSKGWVMLLNICCLFCLENQVKEVGGWAFDHICCFLLRKALPKSLAATRHFKKWMTAIVFPLSFASSWQYDWCVPIDFSSVSIEQSLLI